MNARPLTALRTPGAKPSWAAYASQVDASTPETRDRGMDALRAFAIFGVILGHWLVTAWAVDGEGNLRVVSPLAYLPSLVPMSWVLQTLAIFFFVGGYAAGCSLARLRSQRVETRGTHPAETTPATHMAARQARRTGPERSSGPAARAASSRDWLWGRASRLLAPVAPLLLVWVLLLALLAAAGMRAGSLRSLAVPALGPLWFLGVYGLLTAAAPLLARVRPGRLVPLLIGIVVAVDTARFALDGPKWLGWVNLVAGWLVPYVLGLARARGGLTGRRTAVAMLAGGVAVTVLLVTAFGYPASMIGVTGARVSNLSPPTLAAVGFGIAQVGLALLLLRPLARLMRRPRLWAVVVLANASAMTVFLWHQTALTVVMLGTLPFGHGVPGLLSLPDSATWLLLRAAWLPVPAALVLVLILTLRPAQR